MPPTGPDDDLAKLLPEAPPRPDRREAAIAEALRRFDGEAPSARPAPQRPQWTRPAWTRIGRTQIGVLMSMAVIAVIGLPVAFRVAQEQIREPAPQVAASIDAKPAVSTASPPASPGQSEAEGATAQPKAATQPAPAPQSNAQGLVATQDKPTASVAPAPAAERALPSAPPAPPPPPSVSADQRELALNKLPQFKPATAPAAAKASEAGEALTITGARIARRDYQANSPVTTVADEERDTQSIVVTGSRITRAGSRAAQRGDWNACTVIDPARSLDRCKGAVNPNARGDAGRAASRIADGLTMAWHGDTAGAIAAFDAAIAINPKLAFAYLNRGIAHQNDGETEAALKDFDQAVRYAPHDARGYYHRSLAWRAQGNNKRADADAAYAVGLDRQYEDLFD
jgi:hypothetical protein